jgi:hypothetical protein
MLPLFAMPERQCCGGFIRSRAWRIRSRLNRNDCILDCAKDGFLVRRPSSLGSRLCCLSCKRFEKQKKNSDARKSSEPVVGQWLKIRAIALKFPIQGEAEVIVR